MLAESLQPAMKKLASSLPLLLLCSLSVLSDRFELTCGMKRKGVKEIPCFPGNLPSVKNAPFLSCCLPETLRAVRVGPGPLQPQQQVVTSWRFQETSGWKGEVERLREWGMVTHMKKKQKDMPAYMHVCMCLSSVVGVCEMWVGPRTNCDAWSWCIYLLLSSLPPSRNKEISLWRLGSLLENFLPF